MDVCVWSTGGLKICVIVRLSGEVVDRVGIEGNR
jgi:hypothetical protein